MAVTRIAAAMMSESEKAKLDADHEKFQFSQQKLWATAWGIYYDIPPFQALPMIKDAQTPSQARNLLAAEAMLRGMLL
jgi:hypothetical protein